MKTLKEMIVDQLLDNAKQDATEWHSALIDWSDSGDRIIPEGLPMEGNRIDYLKVSREFLEKQSDETLLRLYTADCCLFAR